MNGDENDKRDATTGRPGRGLVVALVLGVVAVGGYFATGMPGMSHEMSAITPSADSGGLDPSMGPMPFMSLASDEFSARLERPGSFVVNVHVPYEGELDGTDAFIPFDEIVGDNRLPENDDAEIVLYCRSGRMSAIAADELVAAGYSNVVDLEGGMEAWEAAGMPLRSPPRR